MSRDKKQVIKNIIGKAVDNLTTDYAGSSLTDVFIVIDRESGELSVFDDEENCVAKDVVYKWVENPDVDSDITSSVYARDLREAVAEMDDEGKFETLNVYTPFSINLADEDFSVLEELLLVEDDSLVRIDNKFMERMDKEFDEFLDKLLNE
ncbi:hypothetical protein [Dysgonomonas sp. 520]|uniref:hypothetical protein n=1 Tax=Dysgonomonas sp. 520 TaxID=2302931 RepID=UPI0013CF895B|nr:hypothetical protein [Dysgonomonas sp. 520]NDW09746.1 hypothetical protein [Dysgonomonas sp. 520]